MDNFAPQYTLHYNGDLRTTMTHHGSGSEVITDAPLDNHGKGAAFSPTDLTSAALASCMMTMVGIKARDLGVEIAAMEARVEKTMGSGPRRIVRIAVELVLNVPEADERSRQVLERTARTCPVAQSLHPDIDQAVCLVWA
jgi:putative redox protein